MEVRDKKTKKAFIRYLKQYKGMRLFQAVFNFTNEFLDDDTIKILADKKTSIEDTFYWECDEKIKM